MDFLNFQWLAWLAGTVAAYWIAPRGWRDLVLAGVTLAFLALYSWQSAGILAGYTLLLFTVTRTPVVKTLPLVVTALIMVGILVWFKIQQDASGIVETALIPLGLSYYTFRCLHFLLERYKGSVDPATLRELIGYLFFIPTMVIGPIHRFPEYLRDRQRQRWDASLLSQGMERILYGYVKITVLGNFLVNGWFAQWIATVDESHVRFKIYLNAVRNGLDVYFQFAGYSDIAIGFALLLGYRVIENFNWPYLQPNISRFWQCWHISLSRWCRDYVYAVVLSTARSPALAALSTMLIIGLWHAISLNYFLWGLYHALGIIAWQRFQRLKEAVGFRPGARLQALLHVLSVLLTVHFVWFSFFLVREPDLLSALRVYGTLLGLHP